MHNVVRLFDRFTFLQRHVLESALTINNFIGTPTYRVLFNTEAASHPCEKNLIIDVSNINGEAKLTVYMHIGGNIVLLYNDNEGYSVDEELTKKFRNFDFVEDQFMRFAIMKDPLIFKDEKG